MAEKKGKWRKDAHLWARDPDDWYIEPRWVDDALFTVEKFQGVVTDPCCGLGRILDAARAAGYCADGFDTVIRRKDAFIETQDFRTCNRIFENIVANPPYKYDDEFLDWALSHSFKTALLLRAQWANSGKRSAKLEQMPLKAVYLITPRPSMPPGAVIEASGGKDPSGGQQDYAWFVFERGYTAKPTFGWARRAPKLKAATCSS